MKIFSSLRSGFFRTLKSWKGVLLVWLFLLILVSVMAIPLRGALNSAFGQSMITEKLADGFNLEAFMDLGPAFKTIRSFMTSGVFFVFLIGFVLNAFLTGGLFNSVKKESTKFSSREFFGAGAKNFWSFLIISLIITVIINFLSGILIGIPSMIVSMSETISEKCGYSIVISAIAVTILLLPMFLLVADYARAWKAANENDSCFKALGFGFSQTFSNFWSSYLMMVLLILAQIVLGIFILLILPGWKPVTGGGVFLLLIISQLMLYARLLLKTWRYSSVTALMEQNQ